MKAAVVQTKPEFGQKARNIERAITLMETVSADIYLLPELFSTGYLFSSRDELASLAEPVKGEVFDALSRFSESKGCMVFAGWAESQEEKLYNSSMLLKDGELLGVYRKLHLFKDEKSIFDPAENHPMVIKTPEADLGLMVCFDWVFPEMARTLTLKGAQVLCLCANLVLPYCQQAMITRSIENGVFTLLANRVGTEENGPTSLTFTGCSEIIDNRGQVLAKASLDKEEVIFAEIDPSSANNKKITPTNDLIADRRVGYYFMG